MTRNIALSCSTAWSGNVTLVVWAALQWAVFRLNRGVMSFSAAYTPLTGYHCFETQQYVTLDTRPMPRTVSTSLALPSNTSCTNGVAGRRQEWR